VLVGTDNLFAMAETASQAPQRVDRPYGATLGAEATVRALVLARQVTYHWDIASDSVTWSSNTSLVLGFRPEQVTTGRQFAALMDSQNFFSRYDTVLRSSHRDEGDGVGYEIEYRLKSDAHFGIAGAWIEDKGRWFAGPDGAPREALGVMQIADERHDRDQQMSFMSNCDPLTGMMNRARLAEALGEAIAVAQEEKTSCAFAILAVNNLDVMNEAYGFEVADEVIVALGQRLRQVMRMGDGIARYSGSKFGIILNNCKPEELNAALERFMRSVRDSVIETQLGPVWALLSIGAVSLPAMGQDSASAIAHAEEALSEAFRLPGDGFVVYTSSETRKSRRLLNARCATEIVSCLREGLFKLAFQPVFDVKTADVVMHEALLRMEDTDGNLITAGHLVPIAERLGLIRLIDRAVLQLALQTLQSFGDAKLSINISATTVTDPRWNGQLLEMIAAAAEPATRLTVEITETAALDNINTSNAFVQGLRALGVGVALDDFGAGYTSYRNLRELKLTHIKLDGSFCCNLAASSENRTFVQSMVELAHALDLKVIAEWVDTPEDAAVLAELGVDGLQGNMLGEASIIAPWNCEQDSAFALAAPSLAPVDASHFEHATPDITTPRQHVVRPLLERADRGEPEAQDVMAAVPAPAQEPERVEAQPINEVMALDDAALEAEIAMLRAAADETQKDDAEARPPDDAAPETAALEDEDAFALDLDENLSQLRAALAELNSVQQQNLETETDARQAS
jgi:diguanylate cyclase (GGDEF)-like protein